MTHPIPDEALNSHIGRNVHGLTEAARRSSMPAGEQLRFESMLRQMAGLDQRKDPLPAGRAHLERQAGR